MSIIIFFEGCSFAVTVKAMCHEAKTFVEHLKKMHEEGNRGFEEEFKVNELKHDYIKPIFKIITRTEMCVQTQVLCLRPIVLVYMNLQM